MGIHYGKADFINYGKPSLLLDFARNKSLVDRISGNNLITFTRSSIGTYVGADGLIKTASADEPRFDHDSSTGESLGLLIEESRTNLYSYSSDLSNNYWGHQNLLITENSTTSPDGNNTATLLIPTTTLSAHYIKPNIVVTTNYITISIFIKSAGHRYVMIRGDNQSNFHTFDIIDGVITGQSSLNSSTASIKNYGNGWYKCTLSYIPGGTGNDPEIFLANVSDYNTANFSGNGIDGVYFWGAQLEQGSFPTSYIPTSGSTVTRSADIATITGTNFSSFYNPSAGTYIADLKLTNTSVSGLPSPFRTESLFLFFGPSGFFTKNTTSNVQHSQGPITTNRTKWAFYHNASNGYGMTIDGRSPINAAQTIGSSDTNISFGDIQGETAYHLYKMVYYPTRLPNESLQYLTQ